MPRGSSTRSEVITATSTRPKRSASAARSGAENVKNKKKKISNDVGTTASEKPLSKTSAKTKDATKVLTKNEEKEDDESSAEHAYWLMKAEPNSRVEKGVDVKFSIEDLEKASSPEPWDGVRNHTGKIYRAALLPINNYKIAKNHMKTMKKGDLAFFYHSNCKSPGVAGIMEVVEEATVDESAFDKKHPYYDEKSKRENPRWFNVHVIHKETFPSFVPLKQLSSHTTRDSTLANMQLFKQTRLSVSKVSEKEWNFITKLGREGTEELKDS